MACNYRFPTGTIFQINLEFWKKGTFRWENRTSCQVGLKTRPTMVPWSGLELTTSRLRSFIVAAVCHALTHSVTEEEAVLCERRVCPERFLTPLSPVCPSVQAGNVLHHAQDVPPQRRLRHEPAEPGQLVVQAARHLASRQRLVDTRHALLRRWLRWVRRGV